MAKFRTKARAIDLLGKNQIADLPTAITELWKNGYDAYGDLLEANLYEKGYKDYKHNIFTLSDDGHGMTRDDLENKWVVLGTENKKDKDFNTPSEDRFGKEERIPLGEKGIGRLSVAYLGDHMLMITKKKDKPFELLFMNWKVLENLDLYLEDINIPMKSINELDSLNIHYKDLIEEYKENLNSGDWSRHYKEKQNVLFDLDMYKDFPKFLKEELIKNFNKVKHGTIFIVFDPIEEIVDLSKEDITDQAEHSKHVRASITALFNPFKEELLEKRRKILGEDILSPSFNFHNAIGEEINLINYNDFFTRDEFEKCEHWIKGNFNKYGEFNGEIKVFGKIYNYSWQSIRKRCIRNYGEIEIELAFFEGKDVNSSMSKEEYSIYDKKAEEFSGLYVYRDNFRVLPYGRTDYDFLEFELRRSKSAGGYYFSHRKMFGYIGISKTDNPKLIDKSGREGFVSNKASRELKEDLVNFFIQIAKVHYGTKAKPRQNHLNEKKQEKIIEDEKKRNRQELREFRKYLNEKEKEISVLEKEIINFKREVSKKEENKLFAITERNTILNRINVLKKELGKLEIIKPLRLDIRDNDKNKMYEHKEKISILDEILEEYNNEVVENTYINELQEFYKDKYNEVYEDINKSYSEYDLKLIKYYKEIEAMYSNIKVKNMNQIETLSPNSLGIEEISKEDTNKYLIKLERKIKRIKRNQKEKIFPIIDYLGEINFEFSDEEKLEAYKSKYNEMEKKVEALHELAQLGMAIEIIDHQFNVLYSQIASSLRYFNKYINKNDNETLNNYKKLKISFEHLETNHKLLVPLYRTMRRSKTNISGKDIRETIIKFFGKIFEEEGIRFETTINFEKFSFYSFESVINPTFINIINNSIFWLKSKEEKIIIIDCNDRNEVIIANSGEKMKYTDLENCFELFFSQRPGGRGIGLYLARTNLRTVGLDIYSTDNRKYNTLNGACFVITEYSKGDE